jgi:hypothetical protein
MDPVYLEWMFLASGAPDEYERVMFSTNNSSLFQAGQNVLLFANDNARGGPSAAAFYATITYGTAVPEPTGLTLAGITGLTCLLRVWRRRVAV